jgi:hypothetical protein
MMIIMVYSQARQIKKPDQEPEGTPDIAPASASLRVVVARRLALR